MILMHREHPKQLFELNVRFAQRVAELSGWPLEEALLRHTNLYIRFGLGWELDPANAAWQEYLRGLHPAGDPVAWTYAFYLKRRGQAPGAEPTFGCFSYTILEAQRVRLHFHNNDATGYGPLSKEKTGKRLAELKEIFAAIKSNVPGATSVVGASWLYNVEAYRRLFPPAYLATAKAGQNDFPYLPLWGQFVDHRGQIKAHLAAEFLERLEGQKELEGIQKCFPFQALHLECPIQEFYRFYGL